MRKLLLGAVVVFFCASRTSYASTADIFIFLENNPLQGIEVLLNGSSLGLTNKKGEITTDINSTEAQTLTVIEKDRTILEKEITLDSEQDAEISIVLSKSAEPKFSIYKSGDDDSKAFGFFSGKVTNTAGEAISDAYISIENTDISALTDTSGTFNFTLQRGNYDVLVSHQEYAKQNLENIRIIANIGTGAVIKLTSQTQETSLNLDISVPVEEVIILGTYTADENDSFQLEQMATTVVDAIDLEQIIRLGDSNVASVLKRVVGITIKDGKYAIVRGLEGRYTAATLNGFTMPTTNPFRRDAELDLYPADILGGIDVQKSFSSNVPGTASAGVISVKTRGMPNEYINKINASVGMTQDLTGEAFLIVEGDDDFWGYGESSRSLSGDVVSSLDTDVCDDDETPAEDECITQTFFNEVGAQLSNDFVPENKNAGQDYSFGYTLGNAFDLDIGTFAAYASIDFDKSHNAKIDAQIDSRASDRRGDYVQNTLSTSLNSYLVGGLELNDGSTIEGKSMMLRNSDNTFFQFDFFNTDVEREDQETYIEWKERELIAHQLVGSHFLPYAQTIDWRVGLTETNVDTPNRRVYGIEGGRFIPTGYERLWGKLQEDSTEYGLDYLLPIGFNNDIRTDIKLGASALERDRTNTLNRLSFDIELPGVEQNAFNRQEISQIMDPQNYLDGILELKGTSGSTDSYVAEESLSSVYINTETFFYERFTLILGARGQNSEKNLVYPDSRNDPPEPKEYDHTLPNFGLVYDVNEIFKFKAAASETVSYPSLTELADSLFYDERGRKFVGNPDLEETNITNYDLRMDVTLSDLHYFSLAFFSKDIENPIEIGVGDGSGDALNVLSWRNEKEASALGFEFDSYFNLYDGSNNVFFTALNIAYLKTEIKTGEQSVRLQGGDRELQGASPWLGNIQLGYDHLPSGQSATILLNYFDDRIDVVDRLPRTPVVEKGRFVLDANYSVSFLDEALSLSAKIKNLNDAPIEFEQNENIVESWRNGREISLGVSYKF